MQRLIRQSWLIHLALVVVPLIARGDDKPDPLPRGGFFGTQVAPVSDASRKAQKVEPGVGVEVKGVLPGSSAEAAGIKANDVLTAVDGKKVEGIPGFLANISRRKGGDRLKVTYLREGKEGTTDVTMKPRPKESSDDHEVIYSSVASKGGRMRTIITRPRKPGKYPVFYLIQGLGGFSIEAKPGGPGFYTAFIDDFAGRGFVTFRVEKPGQGDSEGGPTQDVDFETELDAYRQGLKQVRSLDYVDPDKILIFGHSMGGVMGPLLAAETPVKGLAVYGTVVKTWLEYLLENTRRQMAFSGDSPGEIDEALRQDALIHTLLNSAGKSPDAIAKEHNELAERIGELFQDGKYYSGRHFGFFRQLANQNLAAAWEKFNGEALAIWGKADFVSTESDHDMIARIVNKNYPGQGTFLPLDGIDHGFDRSPGQVESFGTFGKGGEFNPVILERLRAWSDKVVKGK